MSKDGSVLLQRRGSSINKGGCILSTFTSLYLKNPVAHTWSDPQLIKRKFCCVCRKRTDDIMSIECEGNSTSCRLDNTINIKYASIMFIWSARTWS